MSMTGPGHFIPRVQSQVSCATQHIPHHISIHHLRHRCHMPWVIPGVGRVEHVGDDGGYMSDQEPSAIFVADMWAPGCGPKIPKAEVKKLIRVEVSNDALRIKPVVPKEPPTNEQQLDRLCKFVLDLGGTEDMVAGWTTKTETRKEGNSAGTHDTYYYSPTGSKFRSRREVAVHLKLVAPAPPRPVTSSLPALEHVVQFVEPAVEAMEVEGMVTQPAQWLTPCEPSRPVSPCAVASMACVVHE